MNTGIVDERIGRAHNKAGEELIKHMGKFEGIRDNRQLLREYYCGCFRNEALKNELGEKEYDNELLSRLLPRIINEYGSKNIDINVDDAILRYHRAETGKKILLRSAMAILASKFPQHYIERFYIEPFTEYEVRISRSTRRRNYNIVMDIETLIAKVKNASRIEEIFAKR